MANKRIGYVPLIRKFSVGGKFLPVIESEPLRDFRDTKKEASAIYERSRQHGVIIKVCAVYIDFPSK